ncbi:MAG: hypothetical protein NQU46_05650 [Methanolinea sp.]|nr:hypothetical protein [Methanolinea sp.]
MADGGDGLTQAQLAEIADRILDRAAEDDDALVRELDELPPEIRREILVSDFLNAFQVYYYLFRSVPGELERERLLLQPASALSHGVLLEEIDLLLVIFRVDGGEPVITVTDGDQVLVNYRGKDAHRKALRFIDEAL